MYIPSYNEVTSRVLLLLLCTTLMLGVWEIKAYAISRYGGFTKAINCIMLFKGQVARVKKRYVRKAPPRRRRGNRRKKKTVKRIRRRRR